MNRQPKETNWNKTPHFGVLLMDVSIRDGSEGEGKVLTSDSEGNATWEEVPSSEQIQADWSQDDDTAVDYIQNKPTIPSDISDLTDTTSIIPDEQVNSDWNATSGKAEILNKPTIPAGLPSGNVNNTLRHNGTNWETSSKLNVSNSSIDGIVPFNLELPLGAIAPLWRRAGNSTSSTNRMLNMIDAQKISVNAYLFQGVSTAYIMQITNQQQGGNGHYIKLQRDGIAIKVNAQLGDNYTATDTFTVLGDGQITSNTLSGTSKRMVQATAAGDIVTHNNSRIESYDTITVTASTNYSNINLNGINGNQRVLIANNSILAYRLQVVAISTDGDASKSWEVTGHIKNDNGVLANNCTIVPTGTLDSSIDVIADQTNGALQLQFKHDYTTNVKVSATLIGTEVKI